MATWSADLMKDKKDCLTLPEIARFMAVIRNPRDRLLFELMIQTGRRVSEVLMVRRTDLMPEKGKINFIILKKRRKDLERPRALKDVPPELMVLLDAYSAAMLPEQRLFSICRSWVAKLSKKYAKEAGIEKRVHAHIFRHSFATNLVETGAVRDVSKLRALQQELEHSSMDMTATYLQFGPSELNPAKEELWKRRHPEPEKEPSPAPSV